MARIARASSISNYPFEEEQMLQQRSPLGRLAVSIAGAFAIVAVGALASCAESDVAAPDAAATVSDATPAFVMSQKAAVRRGLATLRRATAKYHRVSVAKDDGFQEAFPENPCLPTNPFGDGALGLPYINVARVDGNLSLNQPEVLFYEPQKNGRLRLVGVEMLIPIAVWEKESPPVVLGQTLHRNEPHGVYGFHAWVWKHNPAGMFASGNTKVSCEFAAD